MSDDAATTAPNETDAVDGAPTGAEIDAVDGAPTGAEIDAEAMPADEAGTDDAVDTDGTASTEADQAEDADDSDDSDDSDDDDDDAESGDPLVEEGDIAADYLERLLDIVDYDGDIDLDVENDRAVVAVIGSGLDDLVGARGETLDALQELTRLAVQQRTGNRSRLMLDIAGHRQSRRDTLTRTAAQAADEVKDSGGPVRLAPMNPFERKVVHDAIAKIDGVHSESEGEEPRRRVVVFAD